MIAKGEGVPAEQAGAKIEWARWDSNPHWHGPKPCASANWATGPRDMQPSVSAFGPYRRGLCAAVFAGDLT